MKYPAENLYRETTRNTTFPAKNVTIDIDGNGIASVGFAIPVPFLSALFLAGVTILGALS